MPLCFPVPLSPRGTSLDEGTLPQPPLRRLTLSKCPPLCAQLRTGWPGLAERALKLDRPWLILEKPCCISEWGYKVSWAS